MKKHIFVLMALSTFTVIQNRCYSVTPKPGDQMLFEAVMRAKAGGKEEVLQQCKQQIIHALEDLDAEPNFVTWMPGTRSKRQFNALNFAIRWYHDRHDDEILRVLLQPMCPKEFEPLLDFEDQFDHRTPRVMVHELFRLTAEECLGALVGFIGVFGYLGVKFFRRRLDCVWGA